MVTSKLSSLSLPPGKWMDVDFGRFSSEMSARRARAQAGLCSRPPSVVARAPLRDAAERRQRTLGQAKLAGALPRPLTARGSCSCGLLCLLLPVDAPIRQRRRRRHMHPTDAARHSRQAPGKGACWGAHFTEKSLIIAAFHGAARVPRRRSASYYYYRASGAGRAWVGSREVSGLPSAGKTHESFAGKGKGHKNGEIVRAGRRGEPHQPESERER